MNVRYSDMSGYVGVSLNYSFEVLSVTDVCNNGSVRRLPSVTPEGLSWRTILVLC